jgi:hypothetical protein
VQIIAVLVVGVTYIQDANFHALVTQVITIDVLNVAKILTPVFNLSVVTPVQLTKNVLVLTTTIAVLVATLPAFV